ncbi:hypothetical protein B0H34DRAFT_695992 [Crassisporium funariophilum]|nr:hypothetical protein B0H34DRAFT_695992 [Crassisporium funariophilum]
MPGLVEVSDLDNNGNDNFVHVPTTSHTPNNEAYTTTFDAAMLTTGGIGNSLVGINLYDSGASQHMSGYRHRFINFVDIHPKPITAANK